MNTPTNFQQVVRNWGEGGEVRLNQDGSIDEIVVNNCHAHLEQMSDSSWWLGLTVNGVVMHINIQSSKGRKITVNCETDDAQISEGFNI